MSDYNLRVQIVCRVCEATVEDLSSAAGESMAHHTLLHDDRPFVEFGVNVHAPAQPTEGQERE